MKYMLLGLIVCCSFHINGLAQNQLNILNGYKIVLLPYQYDEVTNLVEARFKQTGLKVYRLETAIQQDYDFKQDPGLAIVCNLEKSIQHPHTAIRIQLVNAKEQILYEFVGDTKLKNTVGKNLKEDELWVAAQLMKPVEMFQHRFDVRYSLRKQSLSATIKVEQTGETEQSLKNYFSNNKLDPIEGIYASEENSRLPMYKLGIKKYNNVYKAIIIKSDIAHWQPGEVKAIFEPSRKINFYNVKWYMGNKSMQYTFANLEDQIGFYVAFKKVGSDKQSISRFKKLYPVENIQPDTRVRKKAHSSGSGFFIHKDGLIATNHHVVGNSNKISVKVLRTTGVVTYAAVRVTSDPQHDVSILKITDTKFRPLDDLPYRLENYVEIGEPVYTIGYPLNSVMGQNYKVTDGIISAATGAQDDLRFYQISVPLQPGNSGGALFNKMGNVIGITTAKLDQKSVGIPIENVNYALKINYLQQLMEDGLSGPVKFKTGDILREKNLQNQVKVLKSFVCLIEAY